MRWKLAGWLVFCATAVFAAHAAWIGPPPRDPMPIPTPLPRPPTEDERAHLAELTAQFEAQLAQARHSLGRGLRVDELEALGPDGHVLLEGGIPDNPLVPGVGGVEEACPPKSSMRNASVDWRYCPQTGAVRPIIPR